MDGLSRLPDYTPISQGLFHKGGFGGGAWLGGSGGGGGGVRHR